MRRFVVIGQKAIASPDFSLEDLPATSGRLDVLLRCLRAALCVSHGLRRDAIVYLVLLGGDQAPRVVRVDGGAAQFVRPDERSLATLIKKSLTAPAEEAGFVAVRPGIAIARGGLATVLSDLGAAAFYVLEEGAPDVREAALPPGDVVVFVGDHQGFDPTIRAEIAEAGATPVGVGPVSVHADDAVAIVSNELDRRA